MAALKSFFLNGLLSVMDMKQHLMMGTEMANCCGHQTLYSPRSLSVPRPRPAHAPAPAPTAVSLYTNPVIRQNAPDPGVTRLADGSGWVAVVTSDHSSRLAPDPRAFPLYFSRDLVTWQHRGHVFTRDTWPRWARDNMWAPELHHVNGRYILYYAARDERGQQTVGAAVAATGDPFGPFLDIGRPLVGAAASVGGAIDPHYFKDRRSGRDYLLWKEDKPLAFQASVILIRELHPSGVRFLGPPVEILQSSLGNLLEERLVAEAPWMMERGGYYYLFYSRYCTVLYCTVLYYYLFYSSAWFSEMKYHIRVAVSKSVYGPFHRCPAQAARASQFYYRYCITLLRYFL